MIKLIFKLIFMIIVNKQILIRISFIKKILRSFVFQVQRKNGGTLGGRGRKKGCQENEKSGSKYSETSTLKRY